MSAERPLLLLDVDGVVLPLDTIAFGRPAPASPAHVGPFHIVEVSGMHSRIAEHLLAASPRLLEVFEIRWATS